MGDEAEEGPASAVTTLRAGRLLVPAVPSLYPTSPGRVLSLPRTASGCPGPPGARPALGRSLTSHQACMQSHGWGARLPGHLTRAASKGLADQRPRRTGLSPGRCVEVVARVWRGLCSPAVFSRRAPGQAMAEPVPQQPAGGGAERGRHLPTAPGPRPLTQAPASAPSTQQPCRSHSAASLLPDTTEQGVNRAVFLPTLPPRARMSDGGRLAERAPVPGHGTPRAPRGGQTRPEARRRTGPAALSGGAGAMPPATGRSCCPRLSKDPPL